MKKAINIISQESIYLIIILLLIITNRMIDDGILVLRFLLVISLWILPVYLDIKFKIANTLILSFSIYYLTGSFSSEGVESIRLLPIIITMMLYLALIANIFMVIKEFYSGTEANGKKSDMMKLLYVVFAFALIIITIITSYAHIYKGMYLNDSGTFTLSSTSIFSAIYYSGVTYFTVGYGDITPNSDLARMVSLSQMLFGYLVTCLILPTILVAFQKMFQIRNQE